MTTNLQEQLWNAEAYNKNSSIQFESSKKILGEVVFTGFEKILDIGCGDGKITAILAKLVPNGNVIGMDRSSEMISYASAIFKEQSDGKVTFVLKNAEEIDYINEFDVIFSSYALHWVIDFAAFAKKVYEALNFSGKIVFTIPLGISNALEKATDEMIQKREWAPYFHDFKLPWRFSNVLEYDQMLLESGFKKEVLEEVIHKKTFASRKDFENYVVQWYPYSHYVPEDKRAVFFTEIVDRYFELEPLLDSGEAYFEFPRIDIIAGKY